MAFHPVQRGVGVREKPLSTTAMYRFLYQPGELEGGTKHATDPIWSLGVYYIDHYDVKLAQPITYYLARGSEVEARSISRNLLSATTVDPPKRSFVASELKAVLRGTELSPGDKLFIVD